MDDDPDSDSSSFALGALAFNPAILIGGLAALAFYLNFKQSQSSSTLKSSISGAVITLHPDPPGTPAELGFTNPGINGQILYINSVQTVGIQGVSYPAGNMTGIIQALNALATGTYTVILVSFGGIQYPQTVVVS